MDVSHSLVSVSSPVWCYTSVTAGISPLGILSRMLLH